MSPTSAAQQQAATQAMRLFSDVERYRNILPPQYRHHGGGGMCRADGWDVSNHQLDGDFALDEVLGKSVVSSVASSTTTGSTAAEKTWLGQYLADPTGEKGSSERFMSEAKSAAAGPGNILGNVNAGKQAMNAFVQGKAADALKAGAQKIASGAASRIKINQYMTLYNANTTGKGKPRPRIRIQGLPIQVISPALGQGARMAAMGGSASARALMAGGQDLRRLSNLAGKTHWSGAGRMFNGTLGTGILTFAPSLAMDIAKNVSGDLKGGLGFDGRGFAADTAKSQTGNALGLGVAVVFGLAFGTTTAPLLLIGFGLGFAAQVAWGTTGGSEWAEGKAKEAFAR